MIKYMEELMTREEFIVLKLTHLKASMMAKSKNRQTPWLRLVEEALNEAIILDVMAQEQHQTTRERDIPTPGQRQLSMLCRHNHDEFKNFRKQHKPTKRPRRKKYNKAKAAN